MALQLLPEPKELLLVKGMCALDEEMTIALPAGTGQGSWLAARELREEIWAATGLGLGIVKVQAPPRPDRAILLVCGAEQAAAFDVTSFQERLDAPAEVREQAYVLAVQRGRIVLYADAPPGLFYAMQTLRQLVRLQGDHIPSLTIRDWPSLDARGLMLDISRRKVPTVATLKHLVDELSHYKLNVLQLYTEHTFQFPSHPRIGAGCGSLDSEDILELDAHCRQRHVELMPNLQSFGHARNILLLPEYRHLAETDLLWTLSPGVEETYTLLDELYGDMLPSFSSPTLNVDCDETYDLGQGASQPLVDAAGGIPEGVGRVYLTHIMRVRALAARHGKRIQIWADMLLDHLELIGQLPGDVTLLAWHYDPRESYPEVRQLAGVGAGLWICPGTGSWNSLFPRVGGARINIRNLVRDGMAAGAVGMLNTDWGDFGHYQPMGLSWHGYLFGAAQGWTGGTTDDGAFDEAFGPLFFGAEHEPVMEAFDQLARTNVLPGVPGLNRSNTVLALFDDPLAGEMVAGDEALPADTLREMHSLAAQAAEICDALAPGHRHEQTLREMALAGRMTAHAALKTAMGQHIRATLREVAAGGPAEELDEPILALGALAAQLEDVREEWEVLWLMRARRSEIHIPLGFFASAHARLRTARAWLEEQRRAAAAGEPVDADLDGYDASDHRVVWQIWPD
ncbi:MAG: glycoside hydrolase family 20 zincin-like fold domain-containing protein [Anaerolineae bacterium]